MRLPTMKKAHLKVWVIAWIFTIYMFGIASWLGWSLVTTGHRGGMSNSAYGAITLFLLGGVVGVACLISDWTT